MKTLDQIKLAEMKAEEIHRNAENKRQEMLKRAAMDAERIIEDARKALKEKIASLQRQEDDALRLQRDKVISEATGKVDEIKKRADKNSGTAVNLILEKFEESFS